ncbi:MAG: 2,3,4,5-tetrahydropyridine-2,6-dicarboxylate N-succinyltransferase [Pseudomonadales bacterium]|jgi:2,3,4,5-tetrahydropyridine-2-carboxylate N-succinyltransferase|nr:2,3,4,5-tetrahydropyridine-2,6-dicarboxylate N-succinyltransferase [Pseudomonadales bacterium]MDA0760765.1 DapH/DapD/GlmU-related protein [Pseudomonadota bacterium]MDA0956554.1 DapH/DapD/GlmU-related protein [Pseudomonadota bacterium]
MFCIGIGVGTHSAQGHWLDVAYPQSVLNPDAKLIDEINSIVDLQADAGAVTLDSDTLSQLANAVSDEAQQSLLNDLVTSQSPCVLTWLRKDSAITSTPEAYLKLHLLSSGQSLPNSLNLDGIFAALPNVAWTSEGPIAIEALDQALLKARVAGRHLDVTSIDKFPKLTNYLAPHGVRIADSARVRLGAYLGPGTTVMHEGFVNFNAGAEGPNMVEGRISQGVFVRKGSDLGGSASTAGTLSGGGNEVITIGEDCLISANAGTGISLGHRCTIEAGLYITPGTRVTVMDTEGTPVKTVKARLLNGQDDLLFIRHSQTGEVQCRTNQNAIKLNDMLHTHN